MRLFVKITARKSIQTNANFLSTIALKGSVSYLITMLSISRHLVTKLGDPVLQIFPNA